MRCCMPKNLNMRLTFTAFSLAIAALAPSTGLAWFDQGHMMVAAIAWKKLTPTVKSRAIALLKLNPSHDAWLSMIPPGSSADMSNEIVFVESATWPDAIKSNPAYTDDGEEPSGSDAARNVGYADRLQHRYWHFIDTPFSPDGTPTVAPVPPNAQTQIEAFETAIASPTISDDVKSYDLSWLLHLVGDVHQPLHATARFTARSPNGDFGGNLVHLCSRPCRDELHAFWDGVVGDAESPLIAITAADALPDAPPNIASIMDDKAWIAESFQIAQSSVYVAPIGVGTGPYALTPEYKSEALRLANERIEAAGARLGNLLNSNLK